MVIDLAELPLVVPSTIKPPKGRDDLHKRRRHWYYCLKIKGRRHYFTTKAQDYQEARRVYAAARKDQEKGGGPSEKAKCLFSRAAEDWLNGVFARRKLENTIRTGRERLKPINDYFGAMRLRYFVGPDL